MAEVPILATFPKFAAHVSHLSDSQPSIKNENLPKYSEKDVLVSCKDYFYLSSASPKFNAITNMKMHGHLFINVYQLTTVSNALLTH